MAFSVIYDACVLYPASLRDLLVRLAMTGIYQARWTDQILEEMVEGILDDRPDLTRLQLDRTVSLMNAAVRDCRVVDYEPLIAGLELPDPDDCHVMAAAIKSGAQVIVTNNLKDFPAERLDTWGIEAQTPEAFALHALDISEARVIAAIQQQADALKNPPQSVAQLLGRLRKNGLVSFAATVADLLGVTPVDDE